MNLKARSIIMILLLLLSALFVLSLPMGTVSGAATRYVGGGSTYINIQDAINASTDGDIIIVANGTYTQNISIHKFIELKGNSSDNCRITVNSGPAVIVDGTFASIWRMNLSTVNDNNDVVKCINGAEPQLVLCNLNFSGRFCYAVNCDASDATLTRCGMDSKKKTMNAANGAWIQCSNTNVVPGMVEVDGTSGIEVYFSMGITALYEDGVTPIEDADVNMSINGDRNHKYSYLTSHYGMGEPKTDVNGKTSVTMACAIYDGTTAPAWGYNHVKIWKSLPYKAGTLEHEEYQIVTDINDTGSVNIVFSADIRAPVKVTNVTVIAINTTALNVSWNASADPGFNQFTLYSTDSMGGNKLWVANTTDNWSVVNDLTPDTTYYYVVTEWDGAGLESTDSDVASGKTKAIVGTVTGTAKFETPSGAPDTALVELLDISLAVVDSVAVDEVNYNYTFTDVPLQANLTIKATPDAAFLGVVGSTSGHLEIASAEFELNLTNLADAVDVVMPYYTYAPGIFGKINYTGGPKDGKNATNASVLLFQRDEVFNATLNDTINITTEIANATANNITGEYTLPAVPFGDNYTVEFTPRAADLYDVDNDGYEPFTTDEFNFTAEKEVNASLAFRAVPIVLPIISGKVVYRGGPYNGENGTLVKIELYELISNASGDFDILISSTTTNKTTGLYSLPAQVAFNYMLKVIPPTDMLGDVDANESGYLINQTNMFGLSGDVARDFNLEYFEYIPPRLVVTNGTPMGEDVELNEDIVITFNYLVHYSNLQDALNITPAMTGLIFQPDPANNSYIISHPDFEPETQYNISLSENLTSFEGFIFEPGYEGNSWNFTTNDGIKPVDPNIRVNEPEDGDTVEEGSTITVSGTSEGLPEGSVVTVTLGEKEVNTTIDADGNWTVKIKAPDEPGAYELKVEVDGDSETFTINVKEKAGPIWSDITWGLASVCIIIFLIVLVLILVIVVILMAVMMKKKGAQAPPEDQMDLEGEEDWGEEDGEDFEDDDRSSRRGRKGRRSRDEEAEEDDWDSDDEEDEWDSDDEDEEQEDDWDDDEEDEEDDWDDEEEEDDYDDDEDDDDEDDYDDEEDEEDFDFDDEGDDDDDYDDDDDDW